MDPLFRNFFQCYHAEQYWEAHEVLEELWQQQRDNDFCHGLIQIAAIMHQLKRGKVRGARKLAVSALSYLEPFSPQREGVDVDEVLRWLRYCLEVLPEDQIQVKPEEIHQHHIPVCKLPVFD